MFEIIRINSYSDLIMLDVFLIFYIPEVEFYKAALPIIAHYYSVPKYKKNKTRSYTTIDTTKKYTAKNSFLPGRLYL